MCKLLLPAFLLLGVMIAGCTPKTGAGVFSSGYVGAGTGTIAGSGKGTLIGASVGVVAGGLIGTVLDEQDRKIMEQSSPRTVDRMDRGEPLTVNDIVKLHEGGISDDTIIQYIKETKTTYNLSQAQIRRLQNAGVSQRITNYMIETGR